MHTVLGVDPGSACTGYGIVSARGGDVRYIASGTVVPSKTASRHEKLRQIHLAIADVIAAHTPDQFAIENVFYHKNPRSTLVLGEARGAAILAAALADLPVFEYSPREIKLSVTGNGGAHKSQVTYMLEKILSLEDAIKSADESDALAVALCHAARTPERDWRAV